MAVARRSAHMTVMVETAQKAGRMLLRDFGEIENLQVSRKGPGNFVTTADHKSEKLIRSLLEKARPKYGFLMEESGETKGEDKAYRWIVDPLDGTSNFMHGIPHWSVTIALEKDGEIVAGVIYDALKDETFSAEKGTGAFMNNKRLRVAGRTSLAEANMSLDSAEMDKEFGETFVQLNQVLTLRRMGSACLDLAYVAAGRFDGCILHKLQPWDVAAGTLMIREAGGSVSDFAGGKNFVSTGNVVGANMPLHAELLKKMKIKPTAQKAS